MIKVTLDEFKVLFDKIADVVQPNGYVLIGSSEYLAGINSRFEPQRHCRTVYYRSKSAAAPEPTVSRPQAAPVARPAQLAARLPVVAAGPAR